MIIVVEGKNDKNKLLSIYKDANIIITNGSEISNDTINLIKELSKKDNIILCLDPDSPGEKIRCKIMEEVPTCKNVYANKALAISKNKKKVGIEHMKREDIISLFESVYTPNYKGSITFTELYDLGLLDSKVKREKLCKKLNFGYCNGKQLLKRLNMYNIDIEEIRKLIK